MDPRGGLVGALKELLGDLRRRRVSDPEDVRLAGRRSDPVDSGGPSRGVCQSGHVGPASPEAARLFGAVSSVPVGRAAGVIATHGSMRRSWPSISRSPLRTARRSQTPSSPRWPTSPQRRGAVGRWDSCPSSARSGCSSPRSARRASFSGTRSPLSSGSAARRACSSVLPPSAADQRHPGARGRHARPVPPGGARLPR